MKRLVKSLTEWRHDVPSCVTLPSRLEPTPLLDATRAVQTAAHSAYPHDDSPRPKRGKMTKRQSGNQ